MKYVKEEDLKKHKITHSGKQPHECKICEKAFVQLRDLKLHKTMHFDSVRTNGKYVEKVLPNQGIYINIEHIRVNVHTNVKYVTSTI